MMGGGFVGPALGVAGAAAGIGIMAAGTSMLMNSVNNISKDAEEKMRSK